MTNTDKAKVVASVARAARHAALQSLKPAQNAPHPSKLLPSPVQLTDIHCWLDVLPLQQYSLFINKKWVFESDRWYDRGRVTSKSLPNDETYHESLI